MSRAGGRLTILHTSFAVVDDLTRLFRGLAPEVDVRHIVDDSLLDEVLEAGKVTPNVAKRIARYLAAAEDLGSDVVLSQCSSVGEAVAEAAARISVPVVRIDERMARIACESGPRVGVVATLETTLGPTVRLIERTAQSLARPIHVASRCVDGAFEALRRGDRATHDACVEDTARELAPGVDVVVCAQGTMAAIASRLGDLAVPVLSSPRLGAEHALEVLRETRCARMR